MQAVVALTIVIAAVVLFHEATVKAEREATSTLEMRAVYDNQTSQYRVQLACANRVGPVVWVNPLGLILDSSSSDGGEFRLLLPNPASSGLYACCTPSEFNEDTCPSVMVDGTEARFMVVEAEQSALRQENWDLTDRVSTLEDAQTAIRQENTDLTGRVKIVEKLVLFNARLTTTSDLSDGAHIIFTDVTINEGNAYNPSTGEFTVPYNGSYFFTATAVGAPYSKTTAYIANAGLIVDDFIVTYIRTKSAVIYFETGTCTYAAHLTKGQRVWLMSIGDSHYGSPETSFSGFLVRADD